MACLQTKRNHWTFRLTQELNASNSAYFITLTYDDDHLPAIGFSKSDVQLFVKRLRKASEGKIRYYLVAEYGDQTFRAHYHAIMFNIHPDKMMASKLILESWKNGQILVGSCTPASIHYVTKYCITRTTAWYLSDDDELNALLKPFALMSKGIGKQYIEKTRSYHDGNIEHAKTVSPGGIPGSLPRYYAEKLYSKEEREQIAANGLKMRQNKKTPETSQEFRELVEVKDYYVSQTIKTTKSKTI